MEEARVDAFEHYQKRTFRNRVTLMTSVGSQTWTLPVERRGGLPRSQDETLRIMDGSGRKAWQAMRTAYGRAPFFEEMAEGLESVFLSRADTLGAWNRETLRWTADWLGVSVPKDAECASAGRSEHAYAPSEGRPASFKVEGWSHVWDDRHKDIPYASLSMVDALLHLGPEAARRITRNPRSGFPRPE